MSYFEEHYILVTIDFHCLDKIFFYAPKTYRFWMIWGWVINDIILILGGLSLISHSLRNKKSGNNSQQTLVAWNSLENYTDINH